MRTTTYCALVALLVTPLVVCAQSGSADLVDDPRVAAALELLEIWIDAQVDYQDIPGASAGIVYDQDLIWSKGFGFAHVDSRDPVQHLFDLEAVHQHRCDAAPR